MTTKQKLIDAINKAPEGTDLSKLFALLPSGWYEPGEGEDYWCRDEDGNVYRTRMTCFAADHHRIATGNAFPTYAAAEASKDHKLLKLKRRYASS
jgi:hypothetical protein